MLTKDLVEAYQRAPPLALEDILLTPDESEAITNALCFTVIRIIVQFGGHGLEKFRSKIREHAPTTAFKIPLHDTVIQPLQAMNIDEASITGNAEVIAAILKQLGFNPDDEEFGKYVMLFAGDQLSVARIRAVIANRAGHEDPVNALLWLVTVPGLFHYKITKVIEILENYLGEVNRDRTNPGSLSSQNSLLNQKPIVKTSLPPFRQGRDLIFKSLYARVLHCLLLVSDSASLEDYAKTVTWDDLLLHAKSIVTRFADVDMVAGLRETRERTGADGGDMVFESALLFMRDALLLREFCDAVKMGDSGRIVPVLKLWALSFRGSGKTKYAYETMMLIHNITHVWPKPIV